MMETSMAESALALQLSGASSPKPMKPTRPSMTSGAEIMLRISRGVRSYRAAFCTHAVSFHLSILIFLGACPWPYTGTSVS